MAFKKQITNTRGVTSEYHRVSFLAVDANSLNARIGISSYVSEEYRGRDQNLIVDSTAWDLPPSAFVALANAKSLPVSEEQRTEIEAHILAAPPAVAAFLRRALDLTTYAAIASPCYEYARYARRPCTIDLATCSIDPATRVIDPETGQPDMSTGELDLSTGEGVLPDGTRYPADQVVFIGDQPTVPSKFADAVDV